MSLLRDAYSRAYVAVRRRFFLGMARVVRKGSSAVATPHLLDDILSELQPGRYLHETVHKKFLWLPTAGKQPCSLELVEDSRRLDGTRKRSVRAGILLLKIYAFADGGTYLAPTLDGLPDMSWMGEDAPPLARLDERDLEAFLCEIFTTSVYSMELQDKGNDVYVLEWLGHQVFNEREFGIRCEFLFDDRLRLTEISTPDGARARPGDPGWQRALVRLANHVVTFHFTDLHLLQNHLAMHVAAVAIYRCLKGDNPIARLLWPHVCFAPETMTEGYSLLFGTPEAGIYKAFRVEREGFHTFLERRLRAGLTFLNNRYAPPKFLNASHNGRFYAAFMTALREYSRACLTDADALARDPDVGRWWQRLHFPATHPSPGEATGSCPPLTAENLIEACAAIVFQCTAYHSASGVKLMLRPHWTAFAHRYLSVDPNGRSDLTEAKWISYITRGVYLGIAHGPEMPVGSQLKRFGEGSVGSDFLEPRRALRQAMQELEAEFAAKLTPGFFDDLLWFASW